MTYPVAGSGFRSIDRASKVRNIDRTAWAGGQLVVATWDTLGKGTVLTGAIYFGVAFEGRPFFSHGVELTEGNLQANDYPFVNCGVQTWLTTDATQNPAQVFYLGAVVWIMVSSEASYALTHRFSFEGKAMRNREYIN